MQAFRGKAKERLSSLATAALVGWEWLQRATDIFGTFNLAHYRPKDRPDTVRVLHEKTGEENWIPLLDPETGAPLYPELITELDAIRMTRIGGLMIRRDWGKKIPWPTWPKPELIDLTHPETEISDRVYVSFDNWHLKIRVVLDHRDFTVYLGPSAVAKLARFIATFMAVQERG